MTAELLKDVINYHRELASVRAELGRLVADVARLSAAVADLKRDWPTDAAHIVIVDDQTIN
jgi:cell division protein FtsB